MTTTTPGTTIVEVADGVFARLHEGLTNAGVIVSDEGVLVIDSLRVPSFARDLINDVRHLTPKPVRYVIDTHSHWDHSWGNSEFSDALIIGHANCRAEMLDPEITRNWRERVVAQGAPWSEEAGGVRIVPPTLTFDSSMQLSFGDRAIDLRYLGRAHTSGDLFVHLPDDGLVFTGDVAQDSGVPYVFDGFVKDWVETDTRLLELGAQRFVAGHGPVGDASALTEARDFVASLVASTERPLADGRDEASARSSVAAELTERFAGWRGIENVAETAGYAYRQLRSG